MRSLQRLQFSKELTSELEKVIKPLPRPDSNFTLAISDIPDQIETWQRRYSAPVNLNPDYQRGHVWTPSQQKAFLESLLQGNLSIGAKTISFNNPIS